MLSVPVSMSSVTVEGLGQRGALSWVEKGAQASPQGRQTLLPGIAGSLRTIPGCVGYMQGTCQVPRLQQNKGM